jgi:hypothetical protein
MEGHVDIFVKQSWSWYMSNMEGVFEYAGSDKTAQWMNLVMAVI